MYYQEGSYEKAVVLFKAFVNEYPTRKDVATAGNLALDALRKLDKFTEMAALARAFASNGRIADSKFRAEAAAIAKKATERQVTQTVLSASQGDFSDTMLREWEKHKGTKLGEDYLYTAFVKYKDERNIAGVFDFGGRLLGAYPKSKRATDVLATMGTLAAGVADFERAAFMYEQYKQRFPQDKNANELLKNAANIRYQLGDTGNARKDLLQLRSGGSAEDRMWANEMLIKMFADAGDWNGLATAAARAASEHSRWAGATAYAGIAAAEQGQGRQALGTLTRAVRMRAQSDFDREAIGWAQFLLGRIWQAEFESIAFGSASTAERDLASKLDALQQLEKSYVGAINSGTPKWAIAALSNIATAYNEMASFIGNAPVPDGVAGAQLNEYRVALKTEASTYVTKANDTLTACASKASQLKVLSGYAKRCLTRDFTTPVEEAFRRRAGSGMDESLQRELADLRAQLARTPSSSKLLAEIARRAMRGGNFHLARMTLLRATEKEPRNAVLHNLLGVSAWHIGEIDEALDAFETSYKQGNAAATANLAALLQQFGHMKRAAVLARRISSSALSSASEDLHPSVHSLTQEKPGS
jgi:Flp pilus assembly protein TadD/outer membrane protein assembly factor BamD (BamD/ComL family)